jgi:hypothetical protein
MYTVHLLPVAIGFFLVLVIAGIVVLWRSRS